MLKKITEPQAYYQKQGMPGMPANIMPSSAPLPFNKLPQKKNVNVRIAGGIVGLALVLALGIGGIMTAQRQKELGNTAVAPNAPVSEPKAAIDPVPVCKFCAGLCVEATSENEVCAAVAPPAGYACIVNPAQTSERCITVPSANMCSISFTVAEDGVATCVKKTGYHVISANSNTLLNEGDSLPPASKIKYVVEIRATGATKAPVVLTDTFDSNLTFVSSDPTSDGTAVASGRTVTITFPAFTAAGDKKAIYYAQVADSIQPITFVNRVQVTNNGNGAAGPQVAACSVTLKTAATGTATCKGKTAYTLDESGQEVAIADKAALDPGTVFYYKVKVQSAGTTAQPIIFEDLLPKGIEYVEQVYPLQGITSEVNADGSTMLSGSLGILGTTATVGKPEVVYVRYKVKVATTATPGTYTNNAQIKNGDADPIACTKHSVIVPPNGVATCVSKEMHSSPLSATVVNSKINEGSSIDQGTEFYYRVKLSASSMTAGSVTVSDSIPSNLELVNAGSFTNNSGILSKTLDAFSGEKVLEFKVRVKAGNAGSTVTNEASVTTTKGSTNTVVGEAYKCNSSFQVSKYECDSGCSSDAQCKTANNDYTCDNSSKKCRLSSNVESTTCQPKAEEYACNSACTSNDQCASVNSAYVCTSTNEGMRCRRDANKSSESCQTPTTTTTTTSSTVGCNKACSTNADCSNSSHICYSGVCRLETNVESTTCSRPAAAAGQPALPEELPQTGPEDWVNWLKAGLVTLGVGAILLLLL